MFVYYNRIACAVNHIFRGRRGRDRLLVGFTTICAIGAYHN